MICTDKKNFIKKCRKELDSLATAIAFDVKAQRYRIQRRPTGRRKLGSCGYPSAQKPLPANYKTAK